jgi:hypothetical protein
LFPLLLAPYLQEGWSSLSPLFEPRTKGVDRKFRGAIPTDGSELTVPIRRPGPLRGALRRSALRIVLCKSVKSNRNFIEN